MTTPSNEAGATGAHARRVLRAAWLITIAGAVGVRAWNALAGPVLHGYDAWGHVAYVLFLDLHHAVPYGDQGWSYFHPPLYYLLGFALAQLGDGDVVARGLAVIGSAASLGMAWLAAHLVRRALPGAHSALRRSALAWLAFTGTAFLPVHVYVSPMPGNEMLAALLGSAAVVTFLLTQRAHERGEPHALRREIAVGVLAGAGLLTKVSAAVPVAVIVGCAALRALARWRGGAPGRLVMVGLGRRVLVWSVCIGAIAGPFYARNVMEFGTPFMTSHDHPKVRAEEAAQPPGQRGFADFVRLPGMAVLHDSRFDAPHLVHSVWGSVYLNTWFDTYRASQFPRWAWPPPNDYPIHAPTLGMAATGLLPTVVALIGGLLVLRGAVQALQPSAAPAPSGTIVELGLTLLTLGSLAFFVLFALRVPTFAAVKASYLLQLTVPWGWALARAAGEALERARLRPLWRWPARLAFASVGAVACASTLVFTSGLWFPMRPDHPDIHALRAHFGEVAPAREWFLEPGVAKRRHAVELLAAIELGAGNARRAAALYRSIAGGALTPWFVNSLATALALAGDEEQALRVYDEGLSARSLPEMLVNRGVLRARRGDLAGARSDLDRALTAEPELIPGWLALEQVALREGDRAAAEQAHARAQALRGRAPRRFPHGVGDGELDFAGRGQRWMLVWRPDSATPLDLYRPPRARWGPARGASRAGEAGGATHGAGR